MAGGPGLPLFLDQTEARRANKLFLETAPSPLLKALDDRPPSLSQGLDPALFYILDFSRNREVKTGTLFEVSMFFK